MLIFCTPEEERVRDGIERGVGLEPILTKLLWAWLLLTPLKNCVIIQYSYIGVDDTILPPSVADPGSGIGCFFNSGGIIYLHIFL